MLVLKIFHKYSINNLEKFLHSWIDWCVSGGVSLCSIWVDYAGKGVRVVLFVTQAGRTPLHCASINGAKDVVEFLLLEGAFETLNLVDMEVRRLCI